MMKHFLLFLSLTPFFAYSQNAKKIDSLKSELAKASSDSLKIEINNQLFKALYQYDPESAQKHYQEMLHLAQKSGSLTGMYKGSFGAGVYFTMNAKLDSALYYFEKAGEYADRLNSGKLRIESLLAISHTYLWQNDMEGAKRSGKRALSLARETSDSTNIALSFKNLGELHTLANGLDSAAWYYLQGIKILEKSNEERSKLGDLYAGVGEIYMNLNRNEKADEYLDKSIAVYEEIDDYDGVMFASAMKGGLLFGKREYESTIELLIPVLEHYVSVGDPYRISETSRYLGLSYLHTGNGADAERMLSNAVEMGREAGEPINLAENLLAYGNLHMERHKFKEAERVFEEAKALFSEAGFARGMVTSAQKLSQLHEKLGNDGQALSYLKEYVNVKDSLTARENASVVHELEANYQNERKQHQIKLLEAENRLKEEEQARQRNVFAISLTGAAAIIFLLYFLYRTYHRANKKLKELDAFKSRFFANISHEFRTPLTLISGPIENRLRQETLLPEEREDLEMVQKNAKQLLSLVDQLLDLSKLESGAYRLRIECADLSILLRALISPYLYHAHLKGITFTSHIPEHLTGLWFDKDVVQKIVGNLLSNALKYTPEGGTIKVTAELRDKSIAIVCENSGTGIPEADRDKIFDRFYQKNEKAGGVGIGLALVKELTELVGGKLHVKSIPNSLTTFGVTLPVTQDSYKNTEVRPAGSTSASPAEVSMEGFVTPGDSDPESENTKQEQPLLLIVDDNSDIRRFIHNILKEEYQILEAEEGRSGYDLATKHIPDLIISDVMMPGLSGIELCETLKKDERTSHIPLILLTAKAGEENELRGIETGADDYITKPFNSELLRVRIEKLIEIRKNLQARFSQEIILKPKDISITTADEKFLNKVRDILDAHLGNSDFTAEQFSRDIGMSRMQLHRKLKALTGLSTNHFIRLQRINRAADLLSRPGINISEVGYISGFSNPSYFAKCFKDHFGCTPTEFAVRKAAESTSAR